MLDRSKLTGNANGDASTATDPPAAPRDDHRADAPPRRTMAEGLPNWDLKPPNSLLRRPER